MVLVEEEVLTLVLVVQELLDKVMQEELHQHLPPEDTLRLLIIGEAVVVALDREVLMEMNLKEQVVKVYIHQ